MHGKNCCFARYHKPVVIIDIIIMIQITNRKLLDQKLMQLITRPVILQLSAEDAFVSVKRVCKV